MTKESFFNVGDIVQALYDVRFGTDASTVLKGSKGTLKELDDGGSWTVDWWNGITDVSTKQEYFLKSDQSKFLRLVKSLKRNSISLGPPVKQSRPVHSVH